MGEEYCKITLHVYTRRAEHMALQRHGVLTKYQVIWQATIPSPASSNEEGKPCVRKGKQYFVIFFLISKASTDYISAENLILH